MGTMPAQPLAKVPPRTGLFSQLGMATAYQATAGTSDKLAGTAHFFKVSETHPFRHAHPCTQGQCKIYDKG